MCLYVEGRAYVEGALRRVRIGRREGGCRPLQLPRRHVLLPGMVDVHVHFRDWGLAHKETLEGGAAAALAGGVVAVGDMPNTRPHIRTAELYRRRLEEGGRLPIHYRLHMGVPEDLAELEAARPPTVKVYPEDVERYGWSHIEALARACGRLGCRLVLHCEDPAYFRDGERPPEAEARCADRALQLAAHAAIHVTHVSLPYTVERLRGVATLDVTPHHLLLDVERCRDPGLCRVNPPLRRPEDRRRLLALFLAGHVDIYATDHAPHTLEEKRSPDPPPGICSLPAALPLLLSLWRRGLLTLDDAVRLYSARPGRMLDVPTDVRTGHFAVVSLEPVRIRGEDFRGSCRFTPLEGMEAFGRVVATAVRGRIYFADGQVEELAT